MAIKLDLLRMTALELMEHGYVCAWPMHSFWLSQVERRESFSSTETLVQFQRSQDLVIILLLKLEGLGGAG